MIIYINVHGVVFFLTLIMCVRYSMAICRCFIDWSFLRITNFVDGNFEMFKGLDRVFMDCSSYTCRIKWVGWPSTLHFQMFVWLICICWDFSQMDVMGIRSWQQVNSINCMVLGGVVVSWIGYDWGGRLIHMEYPVLILPCMGQVGV